MSIQFKDEAAFKRWQKKAKRLRAQIEEPEKAPILIEMMDEMDKLWRKHNTLQTRVRTLEAQNGKMWQFYCEMERRDALLAPDGGEEGF